MMSFLFCVATTLAFMIWLGWSKKTTWARWRKHVSGSNTAGDLDFLSKISCFCCCTKVNISVVSWGNKCPQTGFSEQVKWSHRACVVSNLPVKLNISMSSLGQKNLKKENMFRLKKRVFVATNIAGCPDFFFVAPRIHEQRWTYLWFRGNMARDKLFNLKKTGIIIIHSQVIAAFLPSLSCLFQHMWSFHFPQAECVYTS